MKAQRVELFVCPMATPADTTGLQKLADQGKIKPDTLVALVGKTEGTGFHDDWGRVWADVVHFSTFPRAMWPSRSSSCCRADARA